MSERIVGEDDREAWEAIASLCKLASLNFPDNTDVCLSVKGKHCGTIIVPWYTLSHAIDRAEGRP